MWLIRSIFKHMNPKIPENFGQYFEGPYQKKERLQMELRVAEKELVRALLSEIKDREGIDVTYQQFQDLNSQLEELEEQERSIRMEDTINDGHHDFLRSEEQTPKVDAEMRAIEDAAFKNFKKGEDVRQKIMKLFDAQDKLWQETKPLIGDADGLSAVVRLKRERVDKIKDELNAL